MKGAPRTARPLSAGEQRWSFEERQRLTRALRTFVNTVGSMARADLALGLGKKSVERVLTHGYIITPRVAEALAAKLGTTADELAKGMRKPATEVA